MGERCRCGAELLPHLHFCVGCGADRQVHEYAGPPPVTTQRPVPAAPPPTLVGQAAMPPNGYPFPIPAQRAVPPTQPPMAPMPPQVPQQPAARPWVPWLIGVSVLLVVMLCAAAVVVTLRPSLLSTASSEPAVAPAEVAPSAQPFLTPTPSPLAPADELAGQVDRDRAQVESVTGRWVPQLSSKRAGTVADGITYTDATILDHYRGLAAQYPGTALLWSGDWPVFKGSDYWVVIVAQPFDTPAEANAWCDAQGFGRQDCLAKNLTHSGTPAGTTVNR